MATSFREAQVPKCFVVSSYRGMLRCAVTQPTGTPLIPLRPPSRPLRPLLVDPSMIAGGDATSRVQHVGVGWPGRAVYPIGPYFLSYFSLFICSGRCARMQTQSCFIVHPSIRGIFLTLRWRNNHGNSICTDTFVSFCVINWDVLRATCCVRTLFRQKGVVRASGVERRPRVGSECCWSRHAVVASPELTLLLLGRVHLFPLGQLDPDQSRRGSQDHATPSTSVTV